MKRVYLSGAISGIPEEEYRVKFTRAEEFYKAIGYDVVNPVKLSDELLKEKPKAKYEDFMKVDLAELKKCTHIAMLDGWEKSNGCRIEREQATLDGLIICYFKVPEDYSEL
jgi:hypothetical protein